MDGSILGRGKGDIVYRPLAHQGAADGAALYLGNDDSHYVAILPILGDARPSILATDLLWPLIASQTPHQCNAKNHLFLLVAEDWRLRLLSTYRYRLYVPSFLL